MTEAVEFVVSPTFEFEQTDVTEDLELLADLRFDVLVFGVEFCEVFFAGVGFLEAEFGGEVGDLVVDV